MSEPRWLTSQEAADLVGVNDRTINRWIKTGELKGTLPSRRAGYRIRLDELERFIDSQSALDAARAVLRGKETGSHELNAAA